MRVRCVAGENFGVELLKPCARQSRILSQGPLVRATGKRKAARFVIEQASDFASESDRVSNFDRDRRVGREIPHVPNVCPNSGHADNGCLEKRHRPCFVAAMTTI